MRISAEVDKENYELGGRPLQMPLPGTVEKAYLHVFDTGEQLVAYRRRRKGAIRDRPMKPNELVRFPGISDA